MNSPVEKTEPESRAERHAEYLDTMADVIVYSGFAGRLEAKGVMLKAAEFIRQTASTVEALKAENAALLSRVERMEKALPESGESVGGGEDAGTGEHQEVLDAINSHNSGEDE